MVKFQVQRGTLFFARVQNADETPRSWIEWMGEHREELAKWMLENPGVTFRDPN